MTRHPYRTAILRALLATAAIPPLTLAQSTSAPATPAGEDPVEMSPFVVSTETERGYQATQSLAGTRIKADLKDVGASIDVLTEQFLNDVGASGMEDAMKYVANVEVFTGRGGDDEGNNSQWFESPFISRGIRTNTVLTDFFPTGAIPIDRYNTESLTFLRGPNAILFGIGSPAGIIGASTKRAMLGKNLLSIRYTTDEHDSHRGEFDVSQVILENKLAVRVAAVAQDKHTFKESSLTRRNAVFGTVTFRPFPRTSLTVSAEEGLWDRVHDQNNIVADSYTPWVMAGRPTVNWLTGAGQLTPGLGKYSTAIGSGLENNSTGNKLVYIEGSSIPIMNWKNMARSANWRHPNQPLATWTPGAMLSTDASAATSTAFTTKNNVLSLPDGTTWDLDLTAYTYGDLRRNEHDYRSKSIFLEQNIVRDLDVELAWNQYTTKYVFDNFGTNTRILADPNELLPDGSPNPYVGRPYIETGNPDIFREKREFDTKRATVSYKLELDDHKIFRNIGWGNYSFSGLYEKQDTDVWLIASREVNTTPLAGWDQRLSDGTNAVQRRYYLEPGESSYQLRGPRHFSQNGVTIDEVASDDTGPRRTFRRNRAFVGAIQGHWWQAREGYYRLVGLYGQREDTLQERRQSFTRGANGVFAADFRNFDSIEPTGVWGPQSRIVADTKTYSVIARPLAAVSFFYNYSDVFRSSDPNNVDIFGNPLRPAYGETDDYGVKLDLWKGRIYATVTKYETVVADSSLDIISQVQTSLNDIYNAINRPDLYLGIKPRAYQDDTSEGVEIALTASITPNWQARATFGEQKTTISSRADEVQAYIDQYKPLWDENASVPLTGTPTAIGADYNTVAHAASRVLQTTSDIRAIIGQRPSDQRRYNASFFTNYTFSSGGLKGFNIGGGVRWASENIIGYARDVRANLDPSRPFEGEQTWDTDMVIGYKRKLFRSRVEWSIQLNIYNVLDEDGPEGKQAVDDGHGRPIVFRSFMKAPRTVQLSTGFKF